MRRAARSRKRDEIDFHNRLRDEGLQRDQTAFKRLTANEKFYAVARGSRLLVERWVAERSGGRSFLDFGCGDGRFARLAASHGGRAVGVDISDVSVANARGLSSATPGMRGPQYAIGDCENLAFQDNAFDLVCVSGVLHHLDASKAFAELARVLRPGGEIICAEALGHNPVFQAYRTLTPHLRTPWEAAHILRRDDIRRASEYFGDIELHFFHLATLAGVPFRSFRGFDAILRGLEFLDGALLRLPVIRWMAWQIVFFLRNPKKMPSGNASAVSSGKLEDRKRSRGMDRSI